MMDALFDPLPPPGPHDWLANHPERPQTFDDFVAFRPNKPEPGRRTIHIQPLGNFGGDSPPLGLLEEFATAFFSLPVKVHPSTQIEVTTRRNPITGHMQLLAPDILQLLAKSIPADAFCVIGITMTDLYPEASWNFVFGQASLRDRAGVYSFARYLPPLSGEKNVDPRLVMRRSCKVLAHETSHMFGIQHCVFYRCLMNGSNHIAESDARPLHLCPVDLRKLQWSVGLDPEQRYVHLLELWRTCGFDDEAEWTRKIMQSPVQRGA